MATEAPTDADAAASGTKRKAEEADLPLSTADSSSVTVLGKDDDAKKLQARREANRMHAFKSRQRSKMLLAELQSTVEQLSTDKAELERHNAVLRAQVEVLQQVCCSRVARISRGLDTKSFAGRLTLWILNPCP